MDRFAAMRVFTAVVEEGGFAAAARKLNLSRAMAAKRVQALEDALGVRLLTRTTRKVTLTEIGQSYFERASQIMSDLETADAEARESAASPRGLLRVTAPVTFGLRHIAPLIGDFCLAHPDLGIDIAYADRRVDLIEEGFDVAVRVGKLEDSSLIARRIGPVAMHCVAAPSRLEQHGEPRDPQELTGHECLIYTYGSASDIWRFRKEGERRSPRVRGRVRSNNGDALMLAACAGAGIALLPDFIVSDAVRAGQLRPILTDWEIEGFDVSALYPGGRRPPAKTRAFVQWLAKAFAGDPPWRCPVPPVIG